MRTSRFSTDQAPTPWDAITSATTYELAATTNLPSASAPANLITGRKITVEECARPGDYPLTSTDGQPLERIYRHRCVEGWSMVSRGSGFRWRTSSGSVSPAARYVALESRHDARQMPMSLRLPDWLFTEGLRMDEATHPLAMLAVGLYREPCRTRTAPIRLVVPWKCGFRASVTCASARRGSAGRCVSKGRSRFVWLLCQRESDCRTRDESGDRAPNRSSSSARR